MKTEYLLENFDTMAEQDWDSLKRHVFDEIFDEMEPQEAGKLELLKKMISFADKNLSYYEQIEVRYLLLYEAIMMDLDFTHIILLPEVLAREKKITDLKEREKLEKCEYMLLFYHYFLDTSNQFYQVSTKEFEIYYKDYKKRMNEAGKSMHGVYDIESKFFWDIDRERSLEAYRQSRQEPRDDMCDCPACERNRDVKIQLALGDKKTADKLAVDLWERKIECTKVKTGIYFTYLKYYIEQKDYKHALEQCKIIESMKKRQKIYKDEDVSYMIRCYQYYDMEKALMYFKKSWIIAEKFKTESGLNIVQEYAKQISLFWKEVGEEMDTIKMDMPRNFPLYQKNNSYVVAELQQYYDRIAKSIQEKFEERKRNYIKKNFEL